MDNWLALPDRPRRMPVWRLCTLMALCFLLLWVGAPILLAPFVFIPSVLAAAF